MLTPTSTDANRRLGALMVYVWMIWLGTFALFLELAERAPTIDA